MRVRAAIIPMSISAIALPLLLGPMAHAATGHGHKPQTGCHQLPPRQVGKAMFYGDGFHGRTMANGEIFDMHAMTAASRTLPLGTRARVTNLKTHRSVIVTITDRGRLRAKNVILDLSVGSARAIGLTEQEGVAPVSIQPVGFTSKAVCS
jgi:rare lipoprotein A